MKIGIDIGGVIITGGKDDTSFFTDDYLKTPEMEGAWVSISYLFHEGHELHIISKCGEKVEEKSIHWLREEHYNWMIPMHRMHFVRKRGLKAPMAMALELDIFIDDREDVLDWMKGIVPHLILFTSWGQVNKELEAILKMDS